MADMQIPRQNPNVVSSLTNFAAVVRVRRAGAEAILPSPNDHVGERKESTTARDGLTVRCVLRPAICSQPRACGEDRFPR